MRLQLEDVELRSLVNRQAEELRQRGSHEVVVERGIDAVWARCDATKIGRAIAQIADNATKFSPEGSTIRFRVVDGSEHHRIEIEDEGVGIPHADLESVFERFYQVDGSLTRAAEGSGIGLSMAQELVRLHGGNITVESRVGEGSVFGISLPVGGEQAGTVRDLRSA
jgi:signal transduction histidine kinase